MSSNINPDLAASNYLAVELVPSHDVAPAKRKAKILGAIAGVLANTGIVAPSVFDLVLKKREDGQVIYREPAGASLTAMQYTGLVNLELEGKSLGDFLEEWNLVEAFGPVPR